MFRLIFQTGPFKGKRLAIQRGPVIIGRDPDCHISVPEDAISRKHAVIELRDDGFFIRDLGSINGILVNEKHCRESRLEHGDTVKIGRTKILFQLLKQADVQEVRLVTHSQGMAFAAVVFIILVQLAFVIGFSVWRRDIAKNPEALPSETSSRPPAPAVAVSNTFAEAEAHLQSVKQAQTETSTAPATTSVTQEIGKLRADVEQIRQRVGELSKPEPPAPTASAKTVAATAEKPPKKIDPLTAKAQQMIQEALLEITNHNVIQADKLLERIQIMAPNYLPAYIERARLFEQRGDLAQSGDQWREVLHRSSGTPLYEQAAAERIRLARLEMIDKTTTAGIPAEKAAPAERLAKRVKIINIEPQRFPENDQFDEMRLLRVSLKPAAGDRKIDPTEIRVTVLFFDEDTLSESVFPTRVATPKDALRLDGEWNPNEQQTVTAAYIVLKGFRNDEFETYSQRCRYHGYLVQVYYKGQLQDEDARPKSLLEKADQFQLPRHMKTQPAVPVMPAPKMTNDEA